MSDQQQPAADPGTETPAPERDWGRILDAAGIIAGIALIVIVIDIWTDGRVISRRLHREPEPEPEAVSEHPAGD